VIRTFDAVIAVALLGMGAFAQAGSDPKGFPSELRTYLSLSRDQVNEISALNQKYNAAVRENEEQSEKLQRQRIRQIENNDDLETLGHELGKNLATIEDKIRSVLSQDQRKRLDEIAKTAEPSIVLKQAAETRLLAVEAPRDNAQKFGGTTTSFASDTAGRPKSIDKTQSKKSKPPTPPRIPPPQ
jgi:hypothetical protein